jgi:hypothetical protein
MTQATQALESLQPYLNRMSDQERRDSRTQVWLDIIPRTEGYSRQATAAADPSDTNEIAIFMDGSQLWWNHELKCWEAGP